MIISQSSLLTKFGRKLLLHQLEKLCEGELLLIEPNGQQHRFGMRTQHLNISVTLHVNNTQFFADAVFSGTVGAGASYIAGLWSCNDLTKLVRIFVANRDLMNGLDNGWTFLSSPILRLGHFLNSNSRQGSVRNIAAHYDIGNALYETMLDPTMAYSCAIFQSEKSTLEEAQLTKFEAVCRKLDLQSQDRVIEIGTGWGGLAIYAAQHYGCHVTTTTISREQYDYVAKKIAVLGLNDRVNLLLQDYRTLEGTYDKAISIEMIEAVGARYLNQYLKKCSALLEPHGAMLLQAITLQDQFYSQAINSVDFIQKFIFPGSFIPSINIISKSLSQATDFKISHLEDIGQNYARTLQEWRTRFFVNIDKIYALGYPKSFIRMWEFYLCYCEGGFEERQLGDVQILLTKPRYRHAPLISTS